MLGAAPTTFRNDGGRRIAFPRTFFDEPSPSLQARPLRPHDTALRMIRDKTAFHYDKLNLDQAIENLDEQESRIYIAEHPVNACYYVGSVLVFRAVFAGAADKPMTRQR
ncbi:hypothetical protein [Mesorhizobium sp. M0323]|uniref:hypothetical protein n=1 Tax=Mesorhizobium sp. M0323 TaxID=2956938 RepID=UPI00333B0F6C